MEATTATRDTDVLCARIVEAVADHTGTDPLSMTPLVRVLDPEALDSLVKSATGVQVTFTYDDHEVVVSEDESISVDGDEYGSPSTDGGR